MVKNPVLRSFCHCGTLNNDNLNRFRLVIVSSAILGKMGSKVEVATRTDVVSKFGDLPMCTDGLIVEFCLVLICFVEFIKSICLTPGKNMTSVRPTNTNRCAVLYILI